MNRVKDSTGFIEIFRFVKVKAINDSHSVTASQSILREWEFELNSTQRLFRMLAVRETDRAYLPPLA